ncbi:LOW QUALITY PROTEIN: uncharacterized protein LOC124255158 [Haliotis rubra]|uniref:LOW QUALITY PROTEIN: uncharacterized protein LOC124255158 n=1 Tax=Haliotis rubra TaxID=36100 RepID=UPI001EE58F64|nr:LOW QUALITY PROTEIN: uncharacterized protein LOC124255158 [Haliotis rubra]
MMIDALQKSITLKDEEIKKLKGEVSKGQKFGVETVKGKAGKLKNLFRYYTGITYIRFLALLQFLVPGDGSFSMTYEKGRCDIRTLSAGNCLFLTLCRLRHNFGLKDIAVRFHLTLQSSGAVFNAWVEHMYLKLGQLSLWPHRDTIISNMPRGFKRDFPNSVIIIDGTELRTQTPFALGLQSQLYSDYKSSTTLKSLVGCDPNGSLTFVSELFTGSISDKALTEQSGFYDVLKVLLTHGYIKEGDAVMADKGFTIEDELSELGLELNIPPFVSSETQMTSAETLATEKIAAHRIHIERLIAKIKKFKIVAHRIPTSLFGRINQIWTVCACMTLFQNIFVTDKHE